MGNHLLRVSCTDMHHSYAIRTRMTIHSANFHIICYLVIGIDFIYSFPTTKIIKPFKLMDTRPWNALICYYIENIIF
jgi:hypothetical protein